MSKVNFQLSLEECELLKDILEVGSKSFRKEQYKVASKFYSYICSKIDKALVTNNNETKKDESKTK
ncbi:MAG: hypothetical protein ACTSR1_00200 [Candidatus Heimdallarchaeota archaeon]